MSSLAQDSGRCGCWSLPTSRLPLPSALQTAWRVWGNLCCSSRAGALPSAVPGSTPQRAQGDTGHSTAQVRGTGPGACSSVDCAARFLRPLSFQPAVDPAVSRVPLQADPERSPLNVIPVQNIHCWDTWVLGPGARLGRQVPSLEWKCFGSVPMQRGRPCNECCALGYMCC